MANDSSVIGVGRAAPTPIFPWNPFQDNLDCHIVDEIMHLTFGSSGKTQFMPRNAPFFARNLSIRSAVGNTTLELGKDYIFANPFNEFIKLYPRNVFGSIIFLNLKTDIDVLVTYDTVGFPFALDDASYAQAVATMYSSPRIAEWSDLINIASSFPPPPHDEDINESYDYTKMMEYFYQMVRALGLMIPTTPAAAATPKAMSLMAEPPTGNTGADYPVITPQEIEAGNISANKLATVNSVMMLLKKVAAGEIKP